MTLQEYNDLYKQPLLKQMTIVSSGGITIKNSNIVSEQMSLEKSLCSETNLRYGRCEAACFKVRIADINHDFTGEWLEVTQDVVTDGEGYLLLQNGQYLLTEDGYKIKLKDEQIDETSATYGRFKVYSDKPSNDRRWRDLTCYDAMYDILNTDVLTWVNGLAFPMTIKNLRDSLFTHLGITQVTKTLINDNFSTPGGFSVSGSLSAKQVIEAICELNGVFGQITSDGKFDYVSLENPPTLTLDYYVDGTGSYEDYVTDAVTGINAKGTSNDVGVTVGTATNLYIISGNPLIYGTEGTSALTTALNTLLQHIMGVQYRPYGVTTYGNPMLPLGTKITINTKNQTIVSYVVKKTLSGIQSLKDTISATGDKHQPTAVNSPTAEIFRTQGKVHELEIDVDGLRSSVTATQTNLANNYSTTQQMNSAIQQSATDITTQVSNTYVTQSAYNAEVQNLQDQIDGRIEYWDGNVVPTLNNAPASSWATTSAKDSHIGDLYRYHHGTPEVTDYYRFDKDSSTTPATYSWVALGESQVDEALRQAELANQKADAAQAQLDALQSSVEDDYYTKTQTDSQISQSASAITQSVSSTYETKSNATSHYNSLDSAAQGYANSALATANTNAQGYANDAKNAANSATDTKLQSYYTKTQTDSQISQTASGITQSVSSTYETKSDASAKLNTANSNAQTYANAARDSANASTDTKLQSYYTKSETKSQVDQTASSITSTVETYTDTKVNSIKIGGENLFPRKGYNGALFHGNKIEKLSYDDYTYGMTATGADLYVYSVATSGTTYSTGYGPLIPIKPGESVYIKIYDMINSTNVFTKNYITLWDANKVSLGYSQWPNTEGIYTCPSTQTTAAYMSLRFGYGSAVTGTRYKARVKIERGNKPTDFSPAQEDIDILGTNLVRYEPTFANPVSYAAYRIPITEKLIMGQTYTLQLWDVNISNSGKQASELCAAFYGGGGWNELCNVYVNGHSDYVTVTFTVSTNPARPADFDNLYLNVYNSPSQVSGATMNLTIGKWKLEKGDKATEWQMNPIDTASKSEVTQLANKIVMKVDGNGNIVQVALSADPSTGTAFTVSANNIDFIADGNIQLTSGTIGIYSTNFQVTSDGTVTVKAGQIGGWNISSDKLYGGTNDYYCAMIKPTANAKYSFASGASNTTYDDAAFRVTPTGTLIVRNIYATASSGNDISSLLTSKNGIWMYGTASGSTIWFSDPNPSTPGFHATMILTGQTGAITCRTLNCSGTKKRVVKTEDYSTRSLYCYETPSPMFGDIGEGKIAEDGKCYVWLDSTFSETIKTESYQIFLQKYGQGECYVTERTSRYFIVEGTEGLSFGWEIKARQKGFENERLENFIEPEPPKDEIDYAEEAIKHFNIIRDEREVA